MRDRLRTRGHYAAGPTDITKTRALASAKFFRQWTSTVRAPGRVMSFQEIDPSEVSAWIEGARAPRTAHLIACMQRGSPDNEGRWDTYENREVGSYEDPVGPDPIDPARDKKSEHERESHVRDDVRPSSSLPESAPIGWVPRICLSTARSVSVCGHVHTSFTNQHKRNRALVGTAMLAP